MSKHHDILIDYLGEGAYKHIKESARLRKMSASSYIKSMLYDAMYFDKRIGVWKTVQSKEGRWSKVCRTAQLMLCIDLSSGDYTVNIYDIKDKHLIHTKQFFHRIVAKKYAERYAELYELEVMDNGIV